MRKVLLVGLVAAVMAVPAMAELTHGDRATAPIYTGEIVAPLGDVGQRCGPTVYDSLYSGTAGYWLYSPVVGPLGYDDYDTISSGVLLSQVKFVGGLTAASGILWFEFYTNFTSPTFVTSFGVHLPASGWWIWTINMGSPFLIPHTGLMQIVANSTFTGGYGTYPITVAGAWFWTSSDAVVTGTNMLGYGTPPATFTTVGGTYSMVHDFAFVIPEPATLALFGAGLLLVVRRRR
jgi:hypothetical protein